MTHIQIELMSDHLMMFDAHCMLTFTLSAMCGKWLAEQTNVPDL